MKCFIDSNVLISAGLFPESVPASAFYKAVLPPNTAFVSDYSLDETHRKIREKFPDKTHDLEAFLYRVFLGHVNKDVPNRMVLPIGCGYACLPATRNGAHL